MMCALAWVQAATVHEYSMPQTRLYLAIGSSPYRYVSRPVLVTKYHSHSFPKLNKIAVSTWHRQNRKVREMQVSLWNTVDPSLQSSPLCRYLSVRLPETVKLPTRHAKPVLGRFEYCDSLVINGCLDAESFKNPYS